MSVAFHGVCDFVQTRGSRINPVDRVRVRLKKLSDNVQNPSSV